MSLLIKQGIFQPGEARGRLEVRSQLVLVLPASCCVAYFMMQLHISHSSNAMQTSQHMLLQHFLQYVKTVMARSRSTIGRSSCASRRREYTWLCWFRTVLRSHWSVNARPLALGFSRSQFNQLSFRPLIMQTLSKVQFYFTSDFSHLESTGCWWRSCVGWVIIAFCFLGTSSEKLASRGDVLLAACTWMAWRKSLLKSF